MTQYPLAPPATRSLAHPTTDPNTLVLRAQTALGWQGSDFLVGLRGHQELIETLESAHDLDGLVRVGDPASPPIPLLRALNRLRSGLKITRIASVPAPWRWVRLGEASTEITGVAVRQQAYRDVSDEVARAAVDFRVLPNHTSTAELLAAAGPLGSVVLDAEEVPAGAGSVPGHLDDQPPVTYGLVSREQPERVEVVWLSMAAQSEAAGTLVAALEQFSALSLNLDFLHSDPQTREHHDFYLGFRCDEAKLAQLQESLSSVGFQARIIAAFGEPS